MLVRGDRGEAGGDIRGERRDAAKEKGVIGWKQVPPPSAFSL